jgi:hypothetical protein
MKKVFLYSPNVPQPKKKNKKKNKKLVETNTPMGLGEFGCEYEGGTFFEKTEVMK